MTAIFPRSPDAVQRERVHARLRRAMAPQIRGLRDFGATGAEIVTIPGLQRTTPLRYVLRCAREMLDASLPDLIRQSMRRVLHHGPPA